MSAMLSLRFGGSLCSALLSSNLVGYNSDREASVPCVSEGTGRPRSPLGRIRKHWFCGVKGPLEYRTSGTENTNKMFIVENYLGLEREEA